MAYKKEANSMLLFLLGKASRQEGNIFCELVGVEGEGFDGGLIETEEASLDTRKQRLVRKSVTNSQGT